ncbi:MAG TPA: amidohydrolase family protein [Phycisphaerae bacterium]|nr:amidohydrolase family protein [Phycisphaerae bacterium]HOJ74783.1 amidohydrolase family protein [Phycisphaerae bacterium]HOM52152.1 amidohydrolase family protein [Phycisphaerae bacterium]HON67163.1 amidohydrolase family protein [Phycisphaerae bacterium]HOQ86670.1 amidohydrolase family protein [Phycisphaerae bacterium]
MSIDPEILQAVDRIQVIDTHEHQEEEWQRLTQKIDFYRLFTHYAASDLVTAGLREESLRKLENPEVPIDEKWRLFEPFYLAARNTAYCKAVQIAIRDLYEIEELDRKTYVTLTERMRERNKPGVVSWILRDRCRIRLAQVNALDTGYFRVKTDAELFQQDLSVVDLLRWPSAVESLERHLDVSITSLAAYADAIEKLFAKYGSMADAIKQQSAYFRPQFFADVPDADAERVFNATLKKPKETTPEQERVMTDWAFHRCVRHCIEHDLPIKIHTGYEAGNNDMCLENLNPNLLSNLFRQYPRAKFDIFHIGYPYEAELVAVAKQYANVYVDMCWAWIIDPIASRHFLKRCLTAVPASKIFAFGGDYMYAEPVYGHLRLARHGIARCLSELVEEEFFTRDQAIAVAHRILHDNAAIVFRVDEKQEILRRAQQTKA